MDASVVDGAVEATVDGDDDLDRLRDVIAQLRLPLYRLGSRLTSLDEVFMQRARSTMTTTSPAIPPGAAGAVYDRGYRPYEGRAAGGGAATFALYRASIRRALGIRRSWRQKVAPFVLLGIVTVPAIVNVGIAYVTRDQIVSRIRIHHLPRVRRSFECAARLRRDHRAGHRLSRSATTGPAVALRPPA